MLCALIAMQDKNQPRSWWLKFEALCHYFSTSDIHSLLGLPHQVNKAVRVGVLVCVLAGFVWLNDFDMYVTYSMLV